MGFYYNATDCNTLSELSSLEPTIDTLAQNYESVKSVLESVLNTVQFNESDSNVELEMRSTIASIGTTYEEFQAAQKAY